jgi:hypothetical protein
MPTARARERGSIIIWATLALAMLLAFLAFVLNVGHSMSVGGELQNAVDSAALAGALQLDGQSDQLSPANTAAGDYAGFHYTDRPDAYQVVADQRLFGTWTPPDRPCLSPDTARKDLANSLGWYFCQVDKRDTAAALRINAVYVHAARATGTPGGGALPVYLNAFMGNAPSTMNRASDAIAVTGGPSESTACLNVPMVIGTGCVTDANTGAGACDPSAPADSPGPMYTIGLSSTSVRSAGWSVFGQSAPSDTAVCQFFQDAAGGKCVKVDIGTEAITSVDIGQGNKMNGGCKGTYPGTGTYSGASFQSVCDWFKPYVGQEIEVPTISESGSLSEACPSTYTGSAYVVGFTTMKVLAVNCTTITGNGNGKGGGGNAPDCVSAPGTDYCNDASAPCNAVASNKCVLTQLVCNHDSGIKAGGGSWTGTGPFRPVLVR